jgi:hypothetical protein
MKSPLPNVNRIAGPDFLMLKLEWQSNGQETNSLIVIGMFIIMKEMRHMKT